MLNKNDIYLYEYNKSTFSSVLTLRWTGIITLFDGKNLRNTHVIVLF